MKKFHPSIILILCLFLIGLNLTAQENSNSNGTTKKIDSDADGIVDAWDDCLETAGIKSEIPGCNGCPDLDEDGYCDAQDPFPDLQVHYICYIPKIVEDIYFLSSFNEITEDSYRELNNFIDTVKDIPDSHWLIEGHTDNVGSKSYNQKLSERRANFVRDYLIEKGIDAKRLKAIGHGEILPIRPNDTERGRAANRRVEIIYANSSFQPRSSWFQDEFVRKEINRLAKKINFYDARITEGSKLNLKIISEYLKQSKSKWEIGVHSDSKGSEKFNAGLTERRAESVKTFLLEQGVPESQLVAKGYGETSPIDTNTTIEGRKNNRRIEFKVIEQ